MMAVENACGRAVKKSLKFYKRAIKYPVTFFDDYFLHKDTQNFQNKLK